LPLTVNGRRVQWLFDTGAGVTLISDAEATRLGLEIRASEGRVSDQNGGNAAARTAIARTVVLGRTQLHDVMFLVMPADQMPWKEWPPGKQGIIGLPVALALDAVRWTRAGTCHSGSRAVAVPTARTSATLRFDDLYVITTVGFDGKSLDFILDTGNQVGTQLWERFGRDFDTLVKAHSRKGTERVRQIGGDNEREITIIPGIGLTVGGKETRLAEGKIFTRPVGNDRFHGLLGMDILSQSTEVTIDFRSMTLTLR
jgi:hypothetical protein